MSRFARFHGPARCGRIAGCLLVLACLVVTGRATYFVRLWTPVAKLVQRVRGNGRIAAPTPGGQGA